MEVGTNECKNCNNSFTGTYCNICGQKVAHRLDFHHVFHELVHVFTHTDKGIFSLIPALLFRPGHLALDYVEGKRKRYFNIFQYLIIIVGIATFMMAKSTIMQDMVKTFQSEAVPQSGRVVAVQQQLMGFVQQYFNLILFALIPVFTFFSWLFFRKKRYNYAEHFVLQVAIQAQMHTLSILLIFPIIFIVQNEMKSMVYFFSFAILLICFTTSNRQFFKVGILQAAVKGILTYIATIFIQMIIVVIITIFLVMRYKGN